MRVHERTPYPVRPKFRANTVQRTLIQSEAVSEIGRDGVGMSNDRLRLPPQNLDAERGVLGSVMLMNEAIDEVDLQAGEFYDVRHQEVYTAIRKLWRDGIRGIDAITLGSELLRTGRFEAAGGTSYLAELLDSVPHAAHVRYYAQIVRKNNDADAAIAARKAKTPEEALPSSGMEFLHEIRIHPEFRHPEWWRDCDR